MANEFFSNFVEQIGTDKPDENAELGLDSAEAKTETSASTSTQNSGLRPVVWISGLIIVVGILLYFFGTK